jgi:hypothetical protein
MNEKPIKLMGTWNARFYQIRTKLSLVNCHGKPRNR